MFPCLMNSPLVQSSSLVMMIFQCLMTPILERVLPLNLRNSLLHLPPYPFLPLPPSLPLLALYHRLHLVFHLGSRIYPHHCHHLDINLIYFHPHYRPISLPASKILSSVQDPLSSVPHQTFQAHRASQLFPSPPTQPQPPQRKDGATIPSHPSLPPKPTAAAQIEQLRQSRVHLNYGT
jgi:hypothetical protein